MKMGDNVGFTAAGSSRRGRTLWWDALGGSAWVPPYRVGEGMKYSPCRPTQHAIWLPNSSLLILKSV